MVATHTEQKASLRARPRCREAIQYPQPFNIKQLKYQLCPDEHVAIFVQIRCFNLNRFGVCWSWKPLQEKLKELLSMGFSDEERADR